jgi:VanZ family protein
LLFLPERRYIRVVSLGLAHGAIAVLCAIFDEWHQSFQPGRIALVSDVVMDACGAVNRSNFCASKTLLNLSLLPKVVVSSFFSSTNENNDFLFLVIRKPP